MKNRIYISIVLSGVLLLQSGCSTNSLKIGKTIEKHNIDDKVKELQNSSNSEYYSESIKYDNQKDIKDELKERKEQTSKVLAPNNSIDYKYFNIRIGDSAKEIFLRLGLIDKNTYIIDENEDFSAKIDSNGLQSIEDVSAFVAANNYTMELTPIENSKYIKVKLKKALNSIEEKLKQTPVKISGNVNIGESIDQICLLSGVNVKYEDKSASEVSGLFKRFSFKGNGLDAVKQLASKSGLGLNFENNNVNISYFDTVTMDIDIFVRDRTMLSIINNTPNKSSGGTTGGTAGSTTPTPSSGGTGNDDLNVLYTTKIFTELKNSIEASLSKYGSYTILPTTGQIVVRDKNENVQTVQKLVSNFNTKFKDTISGRITFYKIAVDKSDKRGIDFKSIIKNKFTVTASGMVGNVFPAIGTASNFGINYDAGGSTTSLFQFLREFGTTEILNSIDFETQSNTLKTIKVANNYGYISSVSSNTTAGTTAGTTTGSITPSSIPDGTFASIIAKNIGNGNIAVDIYATSNSLSKFNKAEAFGTTIQTPDTAEQSVDGYHQVKSGVPYILLSYKYNEIKNIEEGLPVGFDWMKKVGSNIDSDKDVFIIVALEASLK